MESSFGPNSTDEPNLLYKLQCKIKVFNSNNPLPNRGYNLVSCSSKYGLVFVGIPYRGLCVYHLKDLVDKDSEPQHITVNLKETATHIAVSCDQELLAVTGGQLLSIYNIANFQNPNPQSIDITLNKTSTFVSGIQWNPIIADNLALVFFDGSLLVANISASPQVKVVQTKARCLCWSPKGKQLVTGNSDGTLTQYKPDLTPAKNIPAPNLFEGAAVEALAVYWISTFMFAVVYRNATNNSRPVVTVVNTPKANIPHCFNYDDICYSMGTNRPWYYYLQAIPQWHIIMASSSNSMEIATLGSKKDGESWSQWCQSDEARPELPLTDKKIENFPIGISLDTSALYRLPWGESSALAPMPLLHVLSQNGLLTIFNVINLNKEAPPLCSPPKQLTLPAAAMTSMIPGETPAPTESMPAQGPPPLQPKASTAPVQLTSTPQIQSVAPPPQYSASVINIPKPPVPVKSEQKPVPEIKPTPVTQPKAPVTATVQPAQPAVPKPQTPQQTQENAALKAEQERISEMKANQELKDMLVKEVNDFQRELYSFMVKTRETQVKLQRDIDAMKINSHSCSIDGAQLKKECSLEDLRADIVQLKLELVRACAVVAEARTHAEAKDYHQWTQADPLTTKRVASVKKLAYYVQSQLEQAQKALDYKWNEALLRNPHFSKPGQRMIRPILDDVYQPLVKQQEILSRQQAVLRTLRNTLKECDVTPMFKSTSLLRNTPFKNKDPLSKLTKNILNMSIEPETTKEPLLSSQKLDALRDMLSNHKTVKIKPVNVEMRQHLANMKLNYTKSLKEKTQAAVSPTDVKPQIKPVAVKTEPSELPNVKQEPPPTTGVHSIAAVDGVKSSLPGLSRVARTLFTEETPAPIHGSQTIQASQSKQQVQSAFASQYSPITPVTHLKPSVDAPVNTRSVLKDLLQNKQPILEAKAAESKNDGNMFMGQQICSPSAFSPTNLSSTATTTKTTVFPAKPTTEINNIFNKFQPQSFVSETKPTFALESKAQAFVPEPKAQTFIQESKPQTFVQESKPQIFVQESKPQTFIKESNPQPFELKPQPNTQDSLLQEPKTQTAVVSNPKSSETGETEAVETKTLTLKPKVDKSVPNALTVKTSVSSTTNIPDVLKSAPEIAKTVGKLVEKENLPQKSEGKTIQKAVVENKEGNKNSTIQINKTSIFGATTQAPANNSSSSQSSIETTPTESKTESVIETDKLLEKSVTPISSASSIFAAGNATVPSAQKQPPLTITSKSEIVTSKPESISPNATTIETTTSPKPSIFSTNSSSAASVFGSAVVSQVKSTSQAGSIFATAAAASPASVFGSASQGSIFGSSPTSVFAPTTPPVSTTTTETPVFPKTPTSPTKELPSSIFGLPTTTSQSTSIFGSSIFSTSTTTPGFGSSTTSVFASATTKAPVFDANTTTPSVFSSTTTTTQSSIFSSVSSTSSPSAFTPSATQSSVFGSSTETTKSGFGTSGGSVFATATPNSNQTSVFGAQSASTQASSIFGTATSTTQASVFGTPPATTQASVFGSTPTQTSVFGTSDSTTAQNTSLFGGAEANIFAAASISTTSSPSQSSSGSIFGGSSSGSVFGGGNTNVFGNKTTFGQSNQTAASIFGGGGATSFGQKPASNFWSGGGGNTDGGFGSNSGGFGQQPSTQASSIFGNTSGGSFSTPSATGQAFGSPQQGVFSTPQQQTGAGSSFGGSPVFGGNQPVFGSSSSFSSPSSGFGSGFGGGFNKSPSSGFGAPAAFGGGATFGGGAAFGSTSPGKMFGGSTPAPAFSSNQSNATFESLATQNTLTFGNLAQQTGPTQQQTSGFNTSPSFTGWRG